MNKKDELEVGYLPRITTEWLQRTYFFPYHHFPMEPYFFKRGEEVRAVEGKKSVAPLAGDIIGITGVEGVLFQGYAMTVCKDNDHPWDKVEDQLKGFLDKHGFPRPIVPVGTMQENWDIVLLHESEKRVDFVLTGRNLMYELNGRRFTRDEWNRWEGGEELKQSMFPRGHALTGKLFAATKAAVVVMMRTQISLEFAEPLREGEALELKEICWRLVLENG